MTQHHFTLATAGHVDHGKSSLIKALTGIDPDRLPEEKARGITIDLGFAHLELADPRSAEATFDLGIVDVPGHEDFVKNMVAGVGSVDMALLVVAADDGWMPQSEEHLQILEYLGVTHAIVALTKIDLAGPGTTEAIRSIRAQLQGTAFAEAPIIPTSVISGGGLAELKVALAGRLASMPPPRDIGKPRLPVDRVFTLRGIGTVVTGTLIGGTLERGQSVVLQPIGKATRIRTVHSENRELDAVRPGMRAALNLADVTVADKASGGDNSGQARRGQVVTLADFGTASQTCDVLLERSSRLIDRKTPAARPIKDGLRVQIHHGSANSPAHLFLAERKEIAPGERVIAQLRFDTPVFLFAGDRFIVRDWAEQATLAGGTILEPDANRRGFRTSPRQHLLRKRAESALSAVASLEAELERDGIAQRHSVLLKTSFGALEIASAIEQLKANGTLVVLDKFVALGSWWNALRGAATAAVEAHHVAHPEQTGLPLNHLRSTLAGQSALPGTFEALLSDLRTAGFVQVGSSLKRANHLPALPADLQAEGTKLRAALKLKAFDPPSRKELAPNASSQQALRFLIQSGEAIELGGEVVLSAENYLKAAALVQEHLRQRSRATVSELRQIIGTSRRVVVPLLEKLDHEGITKREGDLRVLRRT